MNNNESYKEFIEFSNLPGVKRIIEEEKKIAENISNPEEILSILKDKGDNWLKAYNINSNIMCTLFQNSYSNFRLRAKQLGIDLSKYPEKLEELVK